MADFFLLTAINSISWELLLALLKDTSKLLKKLCRIEGIEWIRLHYAYPSGFPDEIIDVIKREKKICNYLDIPLQHISDKILKSMRRGAGKNKINNFSPQGLVLLRNKNYQEKFLLFRLYLQF